MYLHMATGEQFGPIGVGLGAMYGFFSRPGRNNVCQVPVSLGCHGGEPSSVNAVEMWRSSDSDALGGVRKYTTSNTSVGAEADTDLCTHEDFFDLPEPSESLLETVAKIIQAGPA